VTLPRVGLGLEALGWLDAPALGHGPNIRHPMPVGVREPEREMTPDESPGADQKLLAV